MKLGLFLVTFAFAPFVGSLGLFGLLALLLPTTNLGDFFDSFVFAALWVGTPVWAIVGGPYTWWYLRNNAMGWEFMNAGIALGALSVPVLMLIASGSDISLQGVFGTVIFFCVFGGGFGALWTAAFIFLYTALEDRV
ncbi:MAG: hypothetical protein AAGD04_08235 [Pseudomonadota bacterium]